MLITHAKPFVPIAALDGVILSLVLFNEILSSIITTKTSRGVRLSN